MAAKRSSKLSGLALFVLGSVVIFNLMSFPYGLLLTTLIGIPAFMVYGLVEGWKRKGTMYYVSLSMLIVYATSHAHFVLTDPCRDSRFFCDYYYGFPISFYLTSNYIYLPHFLFGSLAFLIDVAIVLFIIKGFQFMMRNLK